MLNLCGISVRLGGHTILDGASATLKTGARVGLVGRNGAGKSTLMRVIAGEIEPDDGSIQTSKTARIGYLTQDAPQGSATPLQTVLAADTEREALMKKADAAVHSGRIVQVDERLSIIDAYSAPARAAKILAGMGFDESMQHRPLDSFSGGLRMRVALAALLFSQPDILLLDEPSNHLDLESTLWLEAFLKSYRATMLIVSHERDLLNNVADHILHLEQGRTTLYVGGYDAFERQWRERRSQAESERARLTAKRDKLQAFVDRWRAKSHTAKQAQSRVKALAAMEPVAASLEDPTLAFDFPSPNTLRPPLVTLEQASVGYEPDKPVLTKLNLRLDPDDRIALLGRNGNGKTTLARLLAGQLQPMQGEVSMAGRMRVGYFTQYQVEELDGEETPLAHMSRLMPDAPPKAVRAQLGRFGFSGDKATLEVARLSGGERARLALALITRDAPHMLILDEPTNHLDVDTREALVQALSGYEGAVVIVSHDRHMLELIADRLVLVEDGTASEFAGDLGDYADAVLGRSAAGSARKPSASNRKDDRRLAAAARERAQALRRSVRSLEAEIARLGTRGAELDAEMADPALATAADGGEQMTGLMKARAEITARLEVAESRWLEESAQLDQEAV